MANIVSKLSPALLDETTNLLTCSTEVLGKLPGEAGRGFVPSDRLIMEDDHWTSIELPEQFDDA
jgi:hypothetical protein